MAGETQPKARRAAREAALMLLFAADTDAPTEPVLPDMLPHHFWTGMLPEASIDPELESRQYAEAIVHGVASKRDVIDGHIRGASANWRLERMTRVDRALLRMCVWEMLEGVPRAVAIDEAVELAKRYGSDESSRFINGLLDAIATALGSA
jgi:N utilization substance protein B